MHGLQQCMMDMLLLSFMHQEHLELKQYDAMPCHAVLCRAVQCKCLAGQSHGNAVYVQAMLAAVISCIVCLSNTIQADDVKTFMPA